MKIPISNIAVIIEMLRKSIIVKLKLLSKIKHTPNILSNVSILDYFKFVNYILTKYYDSSQLIYG